MIGKRYEYDAMATCEKDLWWYKCLHELTVETITKNQFTKTAFILDAGCGTGGMLTYLQQQGFANLHGFDISTDAVEYAQSITGLPIIQNDLININSTSFSEKNFDIIISSDTFCMIKEPADSRALQNLWQLLKPGGLLIFNIAALKAFRGTHDVSVSIKKRYNKKDVATILPPGVLKTQMLYWPFILSPLIFLLRLIQRMQLFFQPNKKYTSDVKLPAGFINKFFYNITKWENKNIKYKPFGSSLFVVLHK